MGISVIDNDNYTRIVVVMNDKNGKGVFNVDLARIAISEQWESFKNDDTGLEREALAAALRHAGTPYAVVISGLRRCGKSTLLRQIGRRIGVETCYYVNFDDERFLGFKGVDFQRLHELLIEMFGERRVFVFDEIQDAPDWEIFVRRLIDQGMKLYLTGSNASLLSSELGSRLTGRYVSVDLFPFSFTEYLRFRGGGEPDMPVLTTAARGNLRRQLGNYIRDGGIPDALKYPGTAWERTLYENILYRDIASRRQIGDVRALKELAFYLMSNPATTISNNKLKGHLGLGSANTVRSYVDYLESSWLIQTVRKYDTSVKRQQVAPRKMYGIDTGLCRAVGFMASPNRGRMLENAVFLGLRRRGGDIYYIKTAEGFEVDFYLPDSGELIQVVDSAEGRGTIERELRALESAAKETGARSQVLVHGGAFAAEGMPGAVTTVFAGELLGQVTSSR